MICLKNSFVKKNEDYIFPNRVLFSCYYLRGRQHLETKVKKISFDSRFRKVPQVSDLVGDATCCDSRNQAGYVLQDCQRIRARVPDDSRPRSPAAGKEGVSPRTQQNAWQNDHRRSQCGEFLVSIKQKRMLHLKVSIKK